ncbi:MAG TPA: hypothetical protein VIZ65_07375 [Cellvibrionaceae bacterium]
MKLWFLSLLLLPALLSCDRLTSPPPRIYFLSQLEGSVAINIFSVDERKNIIRHTFDEGARETDFALDKQGNMVMSSNRVQSWETYYNSPAKNRKNKIQYFNIFYLPKGAIEKHDKDRAAKALTTGTDQTIQTDISSDGHWVSMIKIVEAPGSKRHDVLAIMDRSAGTTIEEIEQADMITSSKWSPDGTQLLYSSHSYVRDPAKPDVSEPQIKAQLKLYNRITKTTQIVLDEPWPDHEIASPQWSPNGELISLIAHPLIEGKVRKLFVLNVKTQELTALSADNTQVQAPVSWSKDNSQILYGGLVDYKQDWSDELREKVYTGSGQIFITNLKGEKRQLTKGDKVMHTRPTFSPDNKKIAYMYTDNLAKTELDLRIADLEGNTLDTLFHTVDAASQLIWQ